MAGGVVDGVAQVLVGEVAWLGTARDARLGDQGCGACSSAPCAMNDDAGIPTERDRTARFSTGPEDQGNVDSYTGRDRTTRSCAGSEDRGDVDSYTGCDRATGSYARAEESGRSYEGDARSCTRRDRATETRPGRRSHRSPGGVFSPRSGRRSPIRVLSGGQAAGCRNQHGEKRPPLDLPAGS